MNYSKKLSAITRLQSIDVLRGAVMVLMAIDHVRVYSGLPAGGPEPGIFFTRWVTHFCAPAFVFLAGTSAFFHGQKLQSRGKLARYLLTRGLLLVFLELTLIRLQMEPPKVRRYCWWIGISAIIIFLGWGSIVATSQPGNGPFVFRLLAQRKYPASVLYLLMTLGPAIALMPLAEKAKNMATKWLGTIGRVPLFYYLLHIPLIHISALVVAYLRNGQVFHAWYATAPYSQVPPGQQWSLALLYFVILIDVILLYLACRWYSTYKMFHPGKKWLSYI